MKKSINISIMKSWQGYEQDNIKADTIQLRLQITINSQIKKHSPNYIPHATIPNHITKNHHSYSLRNYHQNNRDSSVHLAHFPYPAYKINTKSTPLKENSRYLISMKSTKSRIYTSRKKKRSKPVNWTCSNLTRKDIKYTPKTILSQLSRDEKTSLK